MLNLSNDAECPARAQYCTLPSVMVNTKQSHLKSCRAQKTLQGDSLIAERRELYQSVPSLSLNRSTNMSES